MHHLLRECSLMIAVIKRSMKNLWLSTHMMVVNDGDTDIGSHSNSNLEICRSGILTVTCPMKPCERDTYCHTMLFKSAAFPNSEVRLKIANYKSYRWPMHTRGSAPAYLLIGQFFHTPIFWSAYPHEGRGCAIADPSCQKGTSGFRYGE